MSDIETNQGGAVPLQRRDVRMWLVTVERTIMVMAADERAAERAAIYHSRDEDSDPDMIVARAVSSAEQIPSEWRDGIPWGGDRSDDRTCLQRLDSHTTKIRRDPGAARQKHPNSMPKKTSKSKPPKSSPASPGSAHLVAAEQMDWQQVVLNGGPPCFRLCEDGRFCGRAERWHSDDTHSFISLADLLRGNAANAAISDRASVNKISNP